MEVFPPALVPVLRDRLGARCPTLSEVDDDVLVRLLTTVFFAGLETYEGEHNAIRVVFFGKRPIELVIAAAQGGGMAPMYRWRLLRFDAERPFRVSELVKLSVASGQGRIHTAVSVTGDGRLAITGLAREGEDVGEDGFVTVETSRPGSLSIHSGRDRLLDYERGAILTGGEDVVFSAVRVRRALESAARAAGVDERDVADYLEVVRALVREMASHGRGGILVIHQEEHPELSGLAPYRMAPDTALSSLLRLARRLDRTDKRRSTPDDRPAPGTEDGPPFRHFLRNAFLSEADRIIEEIGALTGIDGATVLSCHLALVAFGVILPVGGGAASELTDESTGRAIDLGSRGTRHRASMNYAAEHPGSVVFVASEDGEVTCMFRDPSEAQALLWRLGPADIRAT